MRGHDETKSNAGSSGRDPRQDAGQDRSIVRRMNDDPEDLEARLDEALDESMDASDPVQLTEPDADTEDRVTKP